MWWYNHYLKFVYIICCIGVHWRLIRVLAIYVAVYVFFLHGPNVCVSCCVPVIAHFGAKIFCCKIPRTFGPAFPSDFKSVVFCTFQSLVQVLVNPSLTQGLLQDDTVYWHNRERKQSENLERFSLAGLLWTLLRRIVSSVTRSLSHNESTAVVSSWVNTEASTCSEWFEIESWSLPNDRVVHQIW